MNENKKISLLPCITTNYVSTIANPTTTIVVWHDLGINDVALQPYVLPEDVYKTCNTITSSIEYAIERQIKQGQCKDYYTVTLIYYRPTGSFLINRRGHIASYSQCYSHEHIKTHGTNISVLFRNFVYRQSDEQHTLFPACGIGA